MAKSYLVFLAVLRVSWAESMKNTAERQSLSGVRGLQRIIRTFFIIHLIDVLKLKALRVYRRYVDVCCILPVFTQSNICCSCSAGGGGGVEWVWLYMFVYMCLMCMALCL